MKLEWFVGWRYLKRRKNFFLSAVSYMAIFGVAIGVMAVIVVLAVMTGFDNELEKKITKNLPPLVVFKNGGMCDYESVIVKLRENAHIISASPFLQGEGLLKYGERVCGVSVMGIEAGDKEIGAGISKNLKYGTFDLGEKVRLENKKKKYVRGIVLGKELAFKLGVVPSVRIQCISAAVSKKSGKLSPFLIECVVTGIFESGMYDVDSAMAYVSLETAQKLFDKKPNTAGGIELKLDDIYSADKVAGDIKEILGPSFSAVSWTKRHKNLFSALRLEKMAMFVILMLIILVAAFNITATLIMVVVDKTRDVGILKSIGVSNRQIMRIFVIDGMLIGLFGVGLGMLLGIGLCTFLNKCPIINLPPDIYLLDRLPVHISAVDIGSICAAAFIISFLSTLYPAWRASRINPVEALRYE